MQYNRLGYSSSAYLRSSSHQPVNWYEFGETAFAVAKEKDLPILLDIGARWCHWCHVIDRESYENIEIAQLINQNYIAIKVDRDQRPDIDARYQQVIASLTGQGGWPLTAFLTYDGRVLYGGTYFPPETMKSLLYRIKELYQKQKNSIMKETLDEIRQKHTGFYETPGQGEHKTTLSQNLVNLISNAAHQSFDSLYGGFGLFPKFLRFSALEFLINQLGKTNNDWQREIIEKTLVEMANGGIYDQIGGGFHRYSTDRQWLIPHFEKMSYDNAEALKVYALAYGFQQNPIYLEVIADILDFTSKVLSDKDNGGFYSSQDADIDLEDDGNYFTWTMDEISAIMPKDEAIAVFLRYGLDEEGNFPEKPGRSVLSNVRSFNEVARKMSIDTEDAKRLFFSGKANMASNRLHRPTPFVDRTIYLNWNCMYVASYFEVAEIMNRPELGEFAQKTLDRLSKTHLDTSRNRLLHVQGVPGFIDDYAWFIRACIKGYLFTSNQEYLELACYWTKMVCELFEDKTAGGFYDIDYSFEQTVALLQFHRKPAEDMPSSSPNAIMIRNLIELYKITGQRDYLAVAEKALNAFAPLLNRHGLFVAAMGTALSEFLEVGQGVSA